MYVNGIQVHKTVEILSMYASALVFLWLANFSQILTNFMLQYDPCKANSKLIKNSFSLLNFSVYSHIHKIRALDSMLGQWNPTKSSLPISLKKL